jgi:hypothetical protein
LWRSAPVSFGFGLAAGFRAIQASSSRRSRRRRGSFGEASVTLHELLHRSDACPWRPSRRAARAVDR